MFFLLFISLKKAEKLIFYKLCQFGRQTWPYLCLLTYLTINNDVNYVNNSCVFIPKVMYSYFHLIRAIAQHNQFN